MSNGSSAWFVEFDGARVIITKARGDGSRSVKGALGARMRAAISNWRSSGLELDIYVRGIDVGASPAYADVEITFGPRAAPAPTSTPTPAPTSAPTPASTGSPSMEPTDVSQMMERKKLAVFFAVDDES